MFVYFLKKLVVVLPTFFGVTLVAFVFIRTLPGDPVMLMAGERGMSEERHTELMAEMGFATLRGGIGSGGRRARGHVKRQDTGWPDPRQTTVRPQLAR